MSSPKRRQVVQVGNQNSYSVLEKRLAENIMAVNDRCRLCKENLRIKGVITNSRIFQKDTNAKSIEERLAEIGLTLANVQERSFRICQKCFRFIARLEESLSTFREWQDAEKEPNHPTIGLSSLTSATTTASAADTTTTTASA